MKLSRAISLLLVCLAIFLLAADEPQKGKHSGDAAMAEAAESPPQVYLVSIPLPLTGAADTRVIATVNKLLSEIEEGTERPILIFEFRPRDEQTEGISHFERSLSLARFLASDRFSRVRTVAFLPTSVDGHAVLPVLACEEIIIAPDAQLGAAGRGEPSIGATMRVAYEEIAQRRRTIPVPFVLGMLDSSLAITEVQLVGGGVRYVLPDELETLRQEAKIWKENSVIPAGDLGIFTGRQLRLEYGFASHLASDRKELAEALKIPPDAIDDETVGQGVWKALRIDIQNRITSRTVDDVIRAIRDAQAEKGANLICLQIDSPGGKPAPALRLVSFLAELDSREVRTVAFVEDEALSVAALVALVCDEVYAQEDAKLGGPGDVFLGPDELLDLRDSVQEAARNKGRDWSLLVGMMDPELEIFRCRREGTAALRYFCELERREQPQPEQWARDQKLELADGLTGLQAKEYRLIQDTATSMDTVLRRLNIDEEIEVSERNRVVSAIERLATQPWFARTLLFVAFFALISEASAPGIGIAGFVSGICFLLFFWCQFLSGTAGWLELVLFVGGLICIGLEIFVIPGFGIFGIGGAAMILGSIVLASQTFIFPRNAYQFGQIPNSLFTLTAACGGVLIAVYVMQRYLTEAPIFRRIMLPRWSAQEGMDKKESVVDWDYLEGKRGVTTTQLTPSGKARFGDEIVNVISDGVLVPRDTPVHVAQVQGNRVLVEPLDEG